MKTIQKEKLNKHNKQTKNEFRNISGVYTGYKREINILFWMDKMSGKPSFLHEKW